MIFGLKTSGAFMATSIGLAMLAAPAMGQSPADDARFEAAQERLDSELVIFKREFDRYKLAQSPAPQAVRDVPRPEAPRANVAVPQPDVADPRDNADEPQPNSDDRERGEEPPR